MPLFLHCRAAGKEMIDILHRQSDNLEAKGVIHSFDGTLEEANTFIQMGYFIGINGWYVEYILNKSANPFQSIMTSQKFNEWFKF